jgi:pimeloyl-ACP methyl ester carboxylesterase
VTALALVHGAGDSSRVWRDVQERLAPRPSVAVDLLGRYDRPFDLTEVTPEGAAEVAIADIVRALPATDDGLDGLDGLDDGIVLVAHSAGSIVLPRIAAGLASRVRHIVFIAGVIAPDGRQAIDFIHPDQRADYEVRRDALLPRYRRHTLVARGVETAANGLLPLDDRRMVQAVDSLNLLFRIVSWSDVPTVPRTYIRCTADQIQTPAMQARLMEASGADEFIDIDADHTPARSQPAALVALLDTIAARHDPR